MSLLTFFAQIKQLNLDVNSFILKRNGKTAAQFYRTPYRPKSPQLLFSLSKSFTSIAVGIAYDEGLLNLSDKVISYFLDKLPATISDNLAEMTIHHLLSMNAGHHENIYSDVAKETDWAKAYLAMEVVHKPGTYYRYSTHSTYMLSAILEKVTGEKLTDYLMPRLFAPLDISQPSWETCPLGVTAGGMGLSIPTEGIANFGQMLLNKGVFNGQRIVSETYISFATSAQSDTSRDEQRIDFSQGYGYQFFLCRDGCYMGNGGFGQVCFVSPKHQIVIAATSNFTSMKQLQTLLDLVFEHILKQIDTDVFHEHDGKKAELEQYLSNMTHPRTTPYIQSEHNFSLDNLHFSLRENVIQTKKLCISSNGSKCELKLVYDDQTVKAYPFDFNRQIHTTDDFKKDLATHDQEVVTHAYWEDSTRVVLTLLYIETPYFVTYSIRFFNEEIELMYKSNASFGIEEYAVIGFKA